MKEKFEIKEFWPLGIAVSLIIGGIPLISSQTTLGIIFIVLAIIITIFWVFFKYASKLPTIIHKSSAAQEAFNSIYELAMNHGGDLYATQICPIDKIPDSDGALPKLLNVKAPLRYHRFIYIEDPQVQDEWVKNTLENCTEHVTPTIYFPDTGKFVPRFFWNIFPRANFLLYSSPKGEYRSLVGLDKILEDDDKIRLATPNFSILFKNRSVYDILHRYYITMISDPLVKSINRLDLIESIVDSRVLETRISSFLVKLSSAVSSSNEVLYCSLFGSQALALEGYSPSGASSTAEADLDLMLVTAPNCKEIVRSRINSLFLSGSSTKIIWGDDESVFYNRRDDRNLNVEIELFEENDEFYLNHPLLGHSILSSACALYIKDRSCCSLGQILIHPTPIPTVQSRLSYLVYDRKGLEDCLQGLNKNSSTVDAKRVILHAVKNIAWAISGSRCKSIDSSIEVIERYPAKDLSLQIKNTIHEVCATTDQNKSVALARSLLKFAKAWSESLISKLDHEN
jgi:hypothetical protein